MRGSGWVRDLREAMSLATTEAQTLQDSLAAFAAGSTREEQMALADAFITNWARSSGRMVNDTYVITSVSDTVIERPGEGVDTVQTALAWTLDSGVENLTIVGGLPVTGTGNALNNLITGNFADNALYGLEGNDFIGAARTRTCTAAATAVTRYWTSITAAGARPTRSSSQRASARRT